jgi:hypothetical protein
MPRPSLPTRQDTDFYRATSPRTSPAKTPPVIVDIMHCLSLRRQTHLQSHLRRQTHLQSPSRTVLIFPCLLLRLTPPLRQPGVILPCLYPLHSTSQLYHNLSKISVPLSQPTLPNCRPPESHLLPAQAQAADLCNTYTLNLPAQPPIRPTRPHLRPLNRSTETCMYLLLPQEELYICSSRLGLIKMDHRHSGNGRNSQQ